MELFLVHYETYFADVREKYVYAYNTVEAISKLEQYLSTHRLHSEKQPIKILSIDLLGEIIE